LLRDHEYAYDETKAEYARRQSDPAIINQNIEAKCVHASQLRLAWLAVL
jgi:hypothetical protein